jgi:predicted  nucleic acid-binding Zn-ribbon protein
MAPCDSKNKALLKMFKSPLLSAKPKDARLELLASLAKTAQINALTQEQNTLFAVYERARKKLKRIEKDNNNLKDENEDLQATTEIANGAIEAISEHMVPNVACAPTPPTDDSSTEMATSRK